MTSIDEMIQIGRQRIADRQAEEYARKAAIDKDKALQWHALIENARNLLPEPVREYVKREYWSHEANKWPGDVSEQLVLSIPGCADILFLVKGDGSQLIKSTILGETIDNFRPGYFRVDPDAEPGWYWAFDNHILCPDLETAMAVAREKYQAKIDWENRPTDQDDQPKTYTLTTTELLIKALTAFIQEQQA